MTNYIIFELFFLGIGWDIVDDNFKRMIHRKNTANEGQIIFLTEFILTDRLKRLILSLLKIVGAALK